MVTGQIIELTMELSGLPIGTRLKIVAVNADSFGAVNADTLDDRYTIIGLQPDHFNVVDESTIPSDSE